MSVTLVGGSETGLLDTSVTQLNRNERSANDTTGADEALYVNVANGNLIIQHRDAYLPSFGADYDLVRTYNSRGVPSDAHQHDDARWFFSTGMRLDVRNGSQGRHFEVEYGDGSVFKYFWDATRGLYVSTDGAGAHETIVELSSAQDGATFILTRADQTRAFFDSQGRLLRWEDTNGVRMTYTYSSDRLVQVQDDQGHTINYLYQNGVLYQVTDETGGVLVEYRYTSGRLTEVIDRMGHSTRYHYTNDGFIERIELPRTQDANGDGVLETYDAREILITYDTVNWRGDTAGRSHIVKSVTDAEGGVTTFDYNFNFATGNSEPTGQGHTISKGKGHLKHDDPIDPSTTYDSRFFQGGSTRVVDALGNNRAYSNEAVYRDWRIANGFYEIYDAAQAATSPSYQAQVDAIRNSHSLNYTYLSNGYITQLVDQEGFQTRYAYDDRGNLTSVVDRNGFGALNSDSAYFRALRAQLGVVDASGNGKLVGSLTTAERTLLEEAFTSLFRYDSRGNLLEAEDNNGSITAFTYTSFNKVATSTSALGVALTTSDAAEYQAKRVELGFAALVANLTAANIAALRALYTTAFTYDSNQNLIEQRDPGGDLTRYEYDANGNLTRKIAFLDPANLTDPAQQQVTQYFYDGFGNNIETVDAEGHHTFGQFDHFGNLTRTIDARGGITSYTYDRDNRLLTVMDPEGHTTVNTYDAVGNRISITDAKGHTVFRFYDRNNRLISTLDPSTTSASADRTTNYSYDVVGNQTSMTDAEGRTTTYTYNARRQMIEILTAQVTGATGTPVQYESAFAYDGEGNRISVTNNRGFTTELLYNEDGLVSRRTDPNGHITQYRYDANNNQVAITAGMQLAAAQRRVLRFAYDEEDQLIREIDAEGNATEYSYDAIGNVLSLTDGNGHRTDYSYDRNNRMIRETRPAVFDPRTGLSTRYVVEHRYDANGNEVELVDENGELTRFSFDKDNRLVLVEDANGIKTVYTYDANHNRTSVQVGVQATIDADQHAIVTNADQAQVTTFTYDEFNQLVARTDGMGNALADSNDARYQQMRVELGYLADAGSLTATQKQALRTLFTTRMSYDRVGNLTQQTDNLGRISSFAYDALNRLETTTDALAGTSTRRYDGNGNLVALTDANGNATAFAYDSVDRQVSRTDALGTATTQAYDAFGNVTSETRAAGTSEARTTQYVYSLNNWLVAQTDPEGHTQSYEYDAVGNRIRVTDGRGQATQTFYDALNRAVRVLDPLSFETRFEYDGVGNRLAMIDARGGITRFAFDPGNRLIETTDAEGRVSRYAYDVRGNRIEMRTAAGTAEEQLTAFEYDAQNNLRRVTDAEGNVTTHDYDRVYNRVETVDGNGHTTVSEFDALNRLLRITNAEGEVTAYEYDAVGNRLRRTDGNGNEMQWVYDDLNRVTREIAANGIETHYGYDRLSNRTSVTTAANTAAASTTTFTYDSDDRLIAQTDALGHTISYAYDANHNRTSVTDAGGHTTVYTYDANNRVTNIEDPEGNVVQYLYDGNGNRVQVIDGRGFATTSYYNANNEIELQVDAEGYARSWQYDRNGNVVAQTLFMSPVGAVSPGTEPTPATSADDQTVLFEYDGVNRVIARVDGEGYRTEFAYDAVGNRLETRQFRDLSGTDVAVTRSFYDSVNRETDRLSAEGYLTRFTYDDAGNILTRTVFNQPATIAGGAPVPEGGDTGRVTQYEYDQVYRLIDETSPLGVVTHYEYDARGNRTAVIDAFGTSDARRSDFTFDAANRLTDIRDALGIVTHYLLDADGNITNQYDAYGTAAQRHTQRVYDGNHRLTQETSALGIVTSYAYDANGNLLAKTIAAGSADQRVETVEYDRNNRIAAQTNGEGERTESAYDGAGNRIRLTIAPGQPEERFNTFEFDRDNRLVRATDGEGVSTTYRYDGADNKVETVQAQGIAGQERHSFYVYDLDNRLIGITDPMGGVTNYEYDVLGNQTRIVNANGGVQANTFDAMGRLLTSVSAGGIRTVNTYDLRGNVASTTQSFADGSDARTSIYGYDLLDRQTSITDGEGYTTSIEYDAFGNQTRVIVGQYLVAASDPSYSAVKAARAHVQINQFAFDAADRMLSMTDGEGNITTYGYDAAGNRTSVTEASNTAPRTTSYRYDLANRLIETITPEAGITRVDYDAAGNKSAEHILQSANGGANIWIHRSFEYDGNARLTAAIDPYGVRTETDYDAMGNAIAVRTAAGTADERVVRTEYDLNNRKTADIDGEGHRTEYAYDAMGNRTRVEDALGRVARYYFDGSNRLIAVLDPEGAVNSFTYDSAGNNIQQRLYANRFTGTISDTTPPVPASSALDRTLATSYDRAGRAISVVEADGTTTLKAYDGAGNLLTETLYANTSSPRTHSYQYDLNNRLEQFTDVDGTLTYFTWDGANNKTSERIVSSTDPNAVRVTRFEYDLNNRLTRQIFDESGLNIVERKVYDSAGNVVEVIDANGYSTTYLYDPANRVTRETNALGHSIQYGYDAVGNNTSVTDACNTVRTFVYDGNNRVIEERGPTVIVHTLGAAPASQQLVLRHEYDALGNEVQTIDAAGYRTTRYFDANGRKIAELSADNVLTGWHYNTFGEADSETLYMTRLTDAAHDPSQVPGTPSGEARTKEMTYDLMGRLTRTLYPAVDVTSVTINASGQPVPTTVTTRPDERAVYDAFGNQVEIFDKNGNRTLQYFDTRGRLVAQVDAEGYLVEWDYDAQDNVLEQRIYAEPLAAAGLSSANRPAAPAGDVHVISRSYDTANRLIAEYTPGIDVVDSTGMSSFERVLTTYTYDDVGNQTSRTRAAGTNQASTEYSYFDAANRRVAVINANRVVHTYAYDANGNLTEQKRYFNALDPSVDLASLNANGTDFGALVAAHAYDQTTVRAWDAANRMTSETDLMSADGGADDITKLLGYNANGAQTWAQDGDGFVTQVEYDRVGRAIRNIAPDGTGSRIEYDAAGNQIYMFTGQIDSEAQPATNITAAFGSNLVIGWDVPSASGARSWLVWDSISRADLSSYASRSEELATWFSGHGELYIPADALGAGDAIYFRVVTADRAGNLSYTGEQVVRVPPRLESINVERTGPQSVRVVVDAAASATNLVLRHGAPGTLSGSTVFTLQADGTYAVELTGVANLAELAYRIDWSDAAGNSYQTSQQTVAAAGAHVAVTTTLGETSVSNGTETGFNITLSTQVPDALASRLSTVAASLQSLDNPSAGLIEVEVAGTQNADGSWTYSLVLGDATQIIPAGNYRVVLTGVYANASEIDALSTVLDQFDVALGSAPLAGTRQSLSWTAPAVGDDDARGQLVIVDGQSVPTLRDPDSQQLTALVNLPSGTHSYDALYGERFGADHTVALTSTEITEEVPDPNDPNAPPTINVLGYDIDVSLTLDASETANVTGQLQLGWRPAGTGLAFANTVALASNGNVFTTTLDELDAGDYDLKLFYVDADGNEVIVDWLRIDAETATLTRTGRSLTVLASETDGSINAPASGLPTITAGIYSGLVSDERNYLTLDPVATGLEGGSVAADGRTTGYFTENRYNALNQLIATNADTGLWREFLVDANGNQVGTLLYGEQGNTEVRDSYTLFDGRNRKVAEYSVASAVFGSTTEQRAVTQFAYDAFDNEIEVIDARGNITLREFNALGLVTREQDRRGAVIEHFYDRLGNETVTRDALYDTSNPLLHTTRKFYDAAGRLIREINGAGDVKEYVYDVFDRRTEVRLIGGSDTIVHSMSYDHRDRMTSYLDGEDFTTNFEYDKRDNRTGVQNANGYWTRQEFDGLNRVTATRYLQNGVEVVERQQYDTYGNLIAQVDGAGRTQSTVYGEFGRKIAEIDAAGRELRYEYDDFGNIIREYRPTAASFSNTGWNEDLIEQYGYWGYQQLLEQWNLAGGNNPDIRREYDEHGRLTRVQDLATGVSTTYQYDLNGNRMAEDVIGTGGHDRHLTYSYDAADQMTRWADSATGMHLNYLWDAAGNQKRVYTDAGYSNAVNHWYDYDGANRVTMISNGEGGAIVSAYGYDEFGNRETWNNAGVIVTYQFDDNGRVISSTWTEGSDAWTSAWSYDNVGNLLNYTTRKNGQIQTEMRNLYTENNLSYYSYSDSPDGDPQETWNTFDTGQRLTNVRLSFGGKTNTYTYHYYADGRERQIVGSGSKKARGTTSFTYDANDKQIRVEKGKGDGMDRNEVLTFVYNNDGQILYRFHDEGSDSNVHTTEFQYANGHPVGERKTQGGTVTELLDSGKYNLVQNLGEDYPGGTVSSVTVVEGDTLQAIAARVYGNPSLWFVIAEANGLDPSQPLKAGTRLTIPNTIETGALTADSHRLYDEADIIGSTLPNLKTPKKKGCGNILAIIIIVVIAVVATILTAGLASVLLAGGGFLGLTGTAATLAAYAVAGAVVGAAASIVQQGLFIALGYQDSFSWKDVAAAAVSGAFSGAAQGIGKAVELGQIVKASTNYARVAASALKVAGEASKQLITNGKITSWASLAGAALAPTKDGASGKTLLEGIGGLSPQHVSMITPWLEVAETYIREGEITSENWINAIGSTVSAAVSDTSGLTGFEAAVSGLGKNLLIGGAMSAFNEEVGMSFLENSIGQEIGSYIGGELANISGLRAWAVAADAQVKLNQFRAVQALASLPAVQRLAAPVEERAPITSPSADDETSDQAQNPLLQEAAAAQGPAESGPSAQRPSARLADAESALVPTPGNQQASVDVAANAPTMEEPILLEEIVVIGRREDVELTPQQKLIRDAYELVAPYLDTLADAQEEVGKFAEEHPILAKTALYSAQGISFLAGGPVKKIIGFLAQQAIQEVYGAKLEEVKGQLISDLGAFIAEQTGAAPEVIARQMDGLAFGVEVASMALGVRSNVLGAAKGGSRIYGGGDGRSNIVGSNGRGGRNDAPTRRRGGASVPVVTIKSREQFRKISKNPQPNTTYEFDGFRYTTDDRGRAISSSGILRNDAGGNRFSDDHTIGHQGKDGDIGFHAGADRFGFQGGPLNVSPGNRSLNSSEYKTFENRLAAEVAAGKKVEADFTRVFNPGNTSSRPDAYVVRYRIDGGKLLVSEFLNQPGG